MEGQRSMLVNSTTDIDAITELLAHCLVDAQAKDIILLNKDGEFLAKSGAVTLESATAISTLAAGVFSATSDLAKLVGEHEFTLTLHQGKETSIHISLVDSNTLLAVIFDNKTPLGAIRFWAKKISSSITPTLYGLTGTQPQEPQQDLRSGLQDAEGNLF
jgi:predicted regulator of Ras-like GTPase activity (Roadblock/LC7/MglB family)